MTASYFTGKNGTIYVLKGVDADVSAADAITAADFSISLSRNVINVGKIGAANDMSYAGKLSITGKLTQVLMTPRYLAWALGTPSPDADEAGTCTPGDPTYFSIWGRVSKDSSIVDISANNCFITGGELPIGDADTVVQCDLPFQIEDPSTDLTLNWEGCGAA